MKRNLEIGLHLASIIKKKENYGLNEVTLPLDEVRPVINHVFVKCTLKDVDLFNEKKRKENSRRFFYKPHPALFLKNPQSGEIISSLPDEAMLIINPAAIRSIEDKQATFYLRFIILILGILLLIQTSVVNAEDKGVLGEVFPIIEEDLSEVIQNKLKSLAKDGTLEKHQLEIQQRVEKGIKRPLPVKNIHTTKVPRRYLFDPSIVVPHDLKDHQGKIFHKAGTRVNPLKIRPLSKPLLFIDGDDQSQVDWAISQHKSNTLTKIILTNGAPLDLTEKYQIPFYFDQGGVMCTRFNLTQIPARLSQKGDLLEIEEIKLD